MRRASLSICSDRPHKADGIQSGRAIGRFFRLDQDAKMQDAKIAAAEHLLSGGLI